MLRDLLRPRQAAALRTIGFGLIGGAEPAIWAPVADALALRLDIAERAALASAGLAALARTHPTEAADLAVAAARDLADGDEDMVVAVDLPPDLPSLYPDDPREEAELWASGLSPSGRRIFLASIWKRLDAGDRRAFLRAAGRRVAA